MMYIQAHPVKEVINLGSDEIDKLSHSSREAKEMFINGIGKNGDELVSLFDINAIIDEHETV